MDLGACEVRTGTVQYSRPQLQSNTSQHSITPVNAHHDDPSSSSITSTPSDPTTAIRWSTPQSRLLTPPVTPKTTEPEHVQTLAANETVYTPSMPPIVRFDEEQVRSLEAQASERPKVNDVDLDSGPPTPSNDDTPYIRFAIDQLTREEDIRTLERQPSGSSADSYPVARVISDHGLGYIKPQNNEDFRKELAAARRDRDALQGEQEEGGLFKFNATRPLTSHSNPTLTDLNLALKPSFDSEIFIPVPPPQKTPRYPDLAFVPTIIRPLAMIVLSLLCVLMIAAIIFCAVHSSQNDGLALYTAGIYGGRYFVFGFLPQIFAACIFIYVQAVMAAITRIMPYTLMAMDEATNRTGALFLGIHPRSLLWPRWDGYLTINICNLGFWLSVFTIPLQSCLFTVLPTAGGWKWTAVQGVAWTLVTIYIIILGATITTCVFFFGRTTGLMWDPRSLADIILMLPRSNILRDFPGTETMESKQEIKNRLAFRSDRLGYWRTPKRTQAMFYCIGEEGASTRQYTLSAGKLHEKPFGEIYRSVDLENVADLYSPHTRFRHLPWFLRDTFVILWSVAAFIILLALIIVSFLPSSAIRKGFPPHVPVVPTDAGFSAANFLYSFIPSILGMILYLLFQPLDMAFRKLQPWAELSQPDGVNAEQSLLLDYPAAFPVSCTISAIGAGHYRVAVLSLLSFFFALLPVLSGGLFFALTTPSGTVRMIPNLPAFYVLLVLLIFYFLGLLLLIPGRHRMHLPHDVDSLSEIISFVHGSRLLDDAPFRAPRSKADLVTRLMAVQREGGVARFAFGVYKGRHGKECLGIDRIGRIGAQEVMVLSGR